MTVFEVDHSDCDRRAGHCLETVHHRGTETLRKSQERFSGL
jgi:hypothetical protein